MKTLSLSGLLKLTHMNLTHIPPGMRFNGDILDLSHNQMAIISTNLFISMTNLRILRLKNNRIDTVRDGVFRGLLHLEDLHLSDNQLGHIPHISYIANLKRFHMAENPISQEDLAMTNIWIYLCWLELVMCCGGPFVETRGWNATSRKISFKITFIYLCFDTNQVTHFIVEWKRAYGESAIILYIINGTASV